MSHIYDDRFYDWVNMTALASARRLLPVARRMVDASSVVDVGCGQGAWLSVWRELGVEDVCGIDGAYVEPQRLLIPCEAFMPADLSQSFGATRRFDVAQSLEVAEHLPPETSQAFVRNLCALADVVIFSAAQPGQGGEMHINERRPSWWADVFRQNGYAAYDCLRPSLAGAMDVSPWYRFNVVLYANANGAARLSEVARASRCDALGDLDVIGDLQWKLRLAVLRPLPVPVVSWLSRARYRVACTLRGHGQAA